MPFLFHVEGQFILVDDKPKQGLFTQAYTKSGFSRPTQLAPYPVLSYGAVLAPENRLYGVFKNTKNQVYTFESIGGYTNRSLLLDDAKQNYDFSNLHLAYFNQHIHFFYTAQKPNSKTYSLLYQILDEEPSNLNTLVSDLSPDTNLKILVSPDALYLFYTNAGQHYTLHAIKLTHQIETFTLIHSEFPITDFNVCFCNATLHLVYSRDIYGKAQIVYTNTSTPHTMPLTLSSATCHPCILSYANSLWVTYIDNNVLYTLLSVDGGASFLGPTPCSIQSHLNTYTFASPSYTLMTTTVYASVLNSLRLPPICALDTQGIHPDLVPNRELALLFQSHLTPLASPLTSSLVPPAAVPVNTPSYEPVQDSFPLSKKQSIKSAAKAFMNESNRFDAPPLK